VGQGQGQGERPDQSLENTQMVLLAVAVGPLRLTLICTCLYSVLSLYIIAAAV
jgi:hypothetical protein